MFSSQRTSRVYTVLPGKVQVNDQLAPQPSLKSLTSQTEGAFIDLAYMFLTLTSPTGSREGREITP